MTNSIVAKRISQWIIAIVSGMLVWAVGATAAQAAAAAADTVVLQADGNTWPAPAAPDGNTWPLPTPLPSPQGNTWP